MACGAWHNDLGESGARPHCSLASIPERALAVRVWTTSSALLCSHLEVNRKQK